MQTRALGNSDLRITRLGFGAWAIGGPGWEFGWGEQDDLASIEAIHRALELGVNWIDTAAVYGLGHSEEVVARAIQSWSGKRPYIFTKCGMIADAVGNVHRLLSVDSIRREVEDSLRRLQVEVIDLYQIHWPPQDEANGLEKAWETLADLQRVGKVRWIGVSNFNLAQLQRVQAIAPVTSLQPPYSLLNMAAEEDLLPYCQEHGIGVLAYSPMASGLLTGAMTRQRIANLAKDDWRRRDAEFIEPRLTQNLELVERLKVVARRHNCAPGEVAIAWVLESQAVTGAIVGARNASQVDGVFHATEVHLGAHDIAEIEAGLRHLTS